MKITKEKLKQIISEELEALNATIEEQAEPPPPPAEPERITSTTQFAQKLMTISKELKSGEVKGLDPKEMTEILEILIDVIKEAEEESSGSMMTQISRIIDSKLGQK
jgi:hypothetical protein